MIKLVLTDMDDTLVPAGAAGASAHAIDGINAALTAGVHFGPVSGRQPEAMKWMFEGHPECYATGAFCNGQLGFLDGELVFGKAFDNDALMRAAAFLEEETSDTCLKVYELGADHFENSGYYITNDAERVRAAVGAGANARLDEFSPNHFDIEDVPHYKANIWSTKSRTDLEALRLQLCDISPELDFVFPSNTGSFVDITPKGWNKGNAVGELARALGIRIDEVAVFGDSYNDLPMIEAAPNAVAMGNANDAVKAAARWGIGDSKDDAVADALFEIAACAKTGEMPSFMRA